MHLCVVANTSKFSTWEAEEGRSLLVQGQSGVHSEFQCSKSSIERTYLKKQTKFSMLLQSRYVILSISQATIQVLVLKSHQQENVWGRCIPNTGLDIE